LNVDSESEVRAYINQVLGSGLGAAA